MDSPHKEIFNFMYDPSTNSTVLHKKGTSLKHYYGIMPIIFLNLDLCTMTHYGDPNLSKPYVYITDHEYLWPDTTLFSIAETYYDFDTRVSRKDMDSAEATKYFLKMNIFRSSLIVKEIDF